MGPVRGRPVRLIGWRGQFILVSRPDKVKVREVEASMRPVVAGAEAGAGAVRAGGGLGGGRALSPLRVGLMAGVVAGLAVLATLDHPGLTIDEPLDVRPGRTYVETLRKQGWRFFRPDVVRRVFGDNAEHPPLGRWLLGLASTVGEPFEVMLRGADPTGLYVVSGRLAPALAFAILAAIVAGESARRWGQVAGLAAGWALVAMPRVFAHAHLAALDTFLALFWTAALLAGARAIEGGMRPGAMVLAGALWSLALLTKIQAWFLLPILGTWALGVVPWRRAVGGMCVWTVTGVGLFLAGWPWLWYETMPRWKTYMVGTTVGRASILVQYFGRVLPDRDVPWHYPWVYFAITVPVGLLALGLLGVLGRGGLAPAGDRRFRWLLGGSVVCFLALFSTRVPVYDGERLFLHVFPAWAMLAGLGFRGLWAAWGGRRVGRWVLAGVLAAQGYGVLALHPFGLSYYNLLVGGLRGAERLGLELTYWGDAVDRVLLDRLAAEARPAAAAALAPTLYPGQGVLTTTGPLVRRRIILQDDAEATRAEWVVVSRRRAYWQPGLIARLEHGQGRQVAARSRQGVWLAALWHFPPPASPAASEPVSRQPSRNPESGHVPLAESWTIRRIRSERTERKTEPGRG